MILYRFFFEWLGDEKEYHVSTSAWWQCWHETFEKLDAPKTEELKRVIHENKFSSMPKECDNSEFSKLLSFYVNYRDDINNSETELYKLKQEYDANPTRKLRRKKAAE